MHNKERNYIRDTNHQGGRKPRKRSFLDLEWVTWISYSCWRRLGEEVEAQDVEKKERVEGKR